MLESARRLGLAVTLALLTLGFVGCGSISSDHVDCNIVKLQSEGGRSDAEIASSLEVPVKDVEACHGSAGGSSGSMIAH